MDKHIEISFDQVARSLQLTQKGAGMCLLPGTEYFSHCLSLILGTLTRDLGVGPSSPCPHGAQKVKFTNLNMVGNIKTR